LIDRLQHFIATFVEMLRNPSERVLADMLIPIGLTVAGHHDGIRE
jgi:hypothetical protein